MTNQPEPIPQAVLRARVAIVTAIATTDIGSGRLLNAVITETLEALRAETIRELVQEAVKPCPDLYHLTPEERAAASLRGEHLPDVPCPECEFREQGARDNAGRP